MTASPMHELSIVESIIDIAEAGARDQNSGSIQVIKIRLGEFTTIVREALEFAFEIARQGTLAQHAVLEIEVVPMTLECVVCNAVTRPERTLCLICTQCGFPLKVASGEELQVEYIELATEAERSGWIDYQCKQTS
jgi:hydrogenase nickel incorporation protein HypA/HybF